MLPHSARGGVLPSGVCFATQEPTTGLDAAIANHLMSTLDRFVKASGKTIVVTIHQPSSQIFYMFSSLLLLSDGEVYIGRHHMEAAFTLKISLTSKQE